MRELQKLAERLESVTGSCIPIGGHIKNITLTLAECEALGNEIAALAAQQDGAWQDMETAPKNGTRIMLFEEKPVKQTSFARWVGAPHSVWIADQGNYIRRPTRWQPVPAPPAT